MKALPFVRAKDQRFPDGPLDLSGILGTWVNTNPDTKGIIRVLLSRNEGDLAVQAFGACEPDPCAWGEADDVVACAAAPDSREPMGFTAHYHFGFMQTRLDANLSRGLLIIAGFHTFLDDSGRSDYFTREFFRFQQAASTT